MILKKTVLLMSFIVVEIGTFSFLIASNTNKESGTSQTSQTSSAPYNPSRFTTHVVSFDTNGGSEIEPITVRHGYHFSKPSDPFKLGYSITAWKYGDKDWNFEADAVMDDMTITIDWTMITYSITYNFEGGETSSEYETSYNIESEFELIRPTKDRNVFAGWFDQNNHRVDSIYAGSTGDLVLTARWLDNLVVKSLDESRGTIRVYGDETNPYKVTLKNIPVNRKHHVFKGWYDNNNNLLSLDDEYTFVMKKDEFNYVDSTYMNDLEEQEWNTNHCIEPKVESNYVYYGIYPQSLVTDSLLIQTLERTSVSYYGGYYYYRGEYYAKEKAILGRDTDGSLLSIRQFDCGEEIIENATYWFKVEPIKWKVLSTEDDNRMLLSEKLLSVQKFYKNGAMRVIDGNEIWPSNYKYSDIRQWLNIDFYYSVFAFNSDNVLTTEVDNSPATTFNAPSEYCCENTFDNVFALSYEDYTNSSYGFSQNPDSSSTRIFKTTDYSRAQGSRYGTESNNLFCGYVWTRSPVANELEEGGFFASRCNKNGTINLDFIGENHSMVQPAINIKI